MQRIKKAAAAICGWECPLLTVIRSGSSLSGELHRSTIRPNQNYRNNKLDQPWLLAINPRPFHPFDWLEGVLFMRDSRPLLGRAPFWQERLRLVGHTSKPTPSSADHCLQVAQGLYGVLFFVLLMFWVGLKDIQKDHHHVCCCLFLSFFPAQIGSGVVRGGPEVRFHQGSTRVQQGSARAAGWCEH